MLDGLVPRLCHFPLPQTPTVVPIPGNLLLLMEYLDTVSSDLDKLTKAGPGNKTKDTLVPCLPINILVTSKINMNNCTCVLLKFPIGVRPQIQWLLKTVLQLHIALPTTFHSPPLKTLRVCLLVMIATLGKKRWDTKCGAIFNV